MSPLQIICSSLATLTGPFQIKYLHKRDVHVPSDTSDTVYFLRAYIQNNHTVYTVAYDVGDENRTLPKGKNLFYETFSVLR